MQFNALLLATLLAAPAQPPANDGRVESTAYRLDKCVVALIDDIEIPAQAAGVLMSLAAVEGSTVHEDELLAQIDDRDAQARRRSVDAEHQRAERQAQSDARVQYAVKAAGVAKSEHDANLQLRRQNPNAVTEFEVDRSRLAWEQATAQRQVSELDRELDRLAALATAAELEVAENEVARRRIEAPVTGVVEEVYRKPGEWVQPGDTVMRLLRMDKLRVHGTLNVSAFSPNDVYGRPVVVEVRMPNGQVERFASRVSYVQPRIEVGGTYLFWAEVENRQVDGRWLLLPGMAAHMDIQLDDLRTAARP